MTTRRTSPRAVSWRVDVELSSLGCSCEMWIRRAEPYAEREKSGGIPLRRRAYQSAQCDRHSRKKQTWYLRRRHSTRGWIHDEAVTKSRWARMVWMVKQPALNRDNYDDNLIHSLKRAECRGNFRIRSAGSWSVDRDGLCHWVANWLRK